MGQKKIDKILSKHLNAGRMPHIPLGGKRKITDAEYYSMWKRAWPDTYKHIIAAMEEYAEQLKPTK